MQVMDIQSERMGTPSGASLEGAQVSRRVLGRGISVHYMSTREGQKVMSARAETRWQDLAHRGVYM